MKKLKVICEVPDCGSGLRIAGFQNARPAYIVPYKIIYEVLKE